MQRHRTDLVSLVFGLLFLALAATGLVDDFRFTVPQLRWLGPALLVALGVAVLFGTFTAGRVESNDATPRSVDGEHLDGTIETAAPPVDGA